MRFSSWSYSHADEILNSKLALKKEIEDAIISIQVPADGFSRPRMNEEIAKQLTTRMKEKGQKWEGSLTSEKVSQYLYTDKSYTTHLPMMCLPCPLHTLAFTNC